MADISTVSNAETLALAVKVATGEKPIVTHYPNYSELSFSPASVENLKGKLRQQVNLIKKAPPGKVRVNLGPVIMPVVLEQTAPFVIGALALAFLAGRVTK